MNGELKHSKSDVWSEWLLHRRHGGDAKHESSIFTSICGIADRVLDFAQLSEGKTLVDIGAGEGLIAFRAIERIGPSLNVILTDISAPMLKHAETIYTEREFKNKCTFLNCPADSLQGIEDDSVDVVITRSVLAYVADKKAAMREFHRVLKPGGRISIAEPIVRDDAFKLHALKKWIDEHPAHENIRLMQLVHRWKSAQYPDTLEKITDCPITNYSERDLFNIAYEGKFSEIHLELHLDSSCQTSISWEVYIECAPHPLAPSLSRILAENFSLEDRIFFENSMRPILEAGQLVGIDRMAYLTATKPTI